MSTDLADELSSLAKEKLHGATRVTNDENGQALAHDIRACDWVVLDAGYDLLSLLDDLPIVVELRLQKECLSIASSREEHFGSMVERHCDDWSLNTHRVGTVCDELRATALDCDAKDSSVVRGERDKLLLRVFIKALGTAREPDAIIDCLRRVAHWSILRCLALDRLLDFVAE